MPRRFTYLLIILISSIAFLSGCSSARDRVSPEWTESMFFKNAQEAMDQSRYDDALYFFEVFLVRYPENHQKVIAAEYERAFIRYKTRDYDEARQGFEDIINKYDESPYAMLYHPRFRQLAEKGLVNIEYKKATERRFLWRMREKEWAEANGKSLLDDGEGEVL